MYISENLQKVINVHADEINNNQFDKVILDTYIQCGEAGLEGLKELFAKAGMDLKLYNKAIERIIKALLRNSDLLN